MEPENVQGKKVTVIGGGRCIFCGWDGGPKGLNDEHIVPYSLGGNAELKEASCTDCEKVTSYVDGYLANAIFKDLRVHSGLQSRSGHPELLAAHVQSEQGSRVVDLAVADHPFFFHMPVWAAPGLIRGLQPSSDFGPAKAQVYWHIPETVWDYIKPDSDGAIRIIDNTPMPNLQTFARGIAKIAFCNAVMKMGLDGFRPLSIPSMIIGRYPHAPFYVGSSLDLPSPPHKEGVLHAVEITEISRRRLNIIVANVRLFAHHAHNENEGMPIYQVVVGVTGKPKAFPRRRGLLLSRTIAF
jgi:hypothetical protein